MIAHVVVGLVARVGSPACVDLLIVRPVRSCLPGTGVSVPKDTTARDELLSATVRSSPDETGYERKDGDYRTIIIRAARRPPQFSSQK